MIFYEIQFFLIFSVPFYRCESDGVPAGEVPNCDACARGAELPRVLRAAGRPTRGPEAQVRPHVSREVLLPQPGMEVTERICRLCQLLSHSRGFFARVWIFKSTGPTLQRQNTQISKHIFPEREYRGLSPNFHIHASVSDLYISTIGLPILLV
jgi:hypothetical protein